VPFVIIQIIMVALVISFPALVSRDLSKGPTIDVDKALQELRRAPPGSGAGEAAGSAGSAGSADAAVSAPASGAASADDEMTKLLLESIKRDTEKKP